MNHIKVSLQISFINVTVQVRKACTCRVTS